MHCAAQATARQCVRPNSFLLELRIGEHVSTVKVATDSKDGCFAVWLFVYMGKFCVVSRGTARAGLRASTRACTSKPTRSSSCPDRCENIQESFTSVTSSLSVWLFLTNARASRRMCCACACASGRTGGHGACNTGMLDTQRTSVCLWLGSLIDSGWMCSCSRNRLWCGRAILKPVCQPVSDSHCGRTVYAQPSLTFHATQVQHFQDEVRPFCRLYCAQMIHLCL
jgi:hypothetical protein